MTAAVQDSGSADSLRFAPARPPSLRGRLMLLVLAVLVPAIVAFGVLVWKSYGEQRRLVEAQIVETARALSLAVDRDLRKNEVLLQALASSPALARGEWAAFDAQARVATRGMDATISLIDPGGFLVASTRAPPGAPIPRVKPEQAGVTIARTREDGARVSNLFRGVGTGLPSIGFDIPAPGPDGRTTRIAAVTPAGALDRLWTDQHFPARWVGTVLDARGVVVSRSRNAAVFVGREVPTGLLRRVRAAPSGIAVGSTLDGVRSVVGWNRSPDYGWTFIVSVPEAEVVGAVERSLAWGGAVGLGLVIGGALLAALLARDIVRPVERLAETAAAWAAGERMTLAPTRTREIDALQARLSESASVIYAQRRELLDLNASLEERVTRRTRELAEATESLAQAQKMEAVGRLTGGVAHDFNNLLMAVLGNLDLLARRLVEPRLLRFVDQARSAAERGAVLTSQLLAFSRRQRLEPRAIDVGTQVRAAIDLLHPTFGFTHTIETQIAADLWPAMADPTQLDLMIVNLALNARDALSDGGVITLSVSNAPGEPARESPEAPPAGDYVVVAVSDKGEGMTPEVLARAFEPFFTTKRLGKGSGLGLSQVLGLAKQLGGGVDVETAPGAGSTFRVYLPRAEVAEQPGSEPEREPDVTVLKHLTLLLVDDDPAVRTVVASMLRDLGCQVTEARDGEAAITELRRAPDHAAAALIDFAMPGLNGGETAAALRVVRPDLPVVLMSGYADLDALSGAWSGPVLRKPFNRAELARELARATAPGEHTSSRTG
jgi:signal transduction histidine kinase/ActR/RegA family two-component response regulator